jgi:hypothetical protein
VNSQRQKRRRQIRGWKTSVKEEKRGFFKKVIQILGHYSSFFNMFPIIIR